MRQPPAIAAHRHPPSERTGGSLVKACALLVPLLVGCKKPEAAPTDLDALARFFLAQAEIQDHPRILEGGENLVAWFEASGLDGTPTGGTLTDLTQEETGAISDLGWDPDPTPCAGVYVIARSTCTMDQAAAISLVEDQSTVFPTHYKSYVRTWLSDPSCWDQGCDAADWISDIVDEMAGGIAEFTYQFVVRMRQSRDDAGVPFVLLFRTVLPEPADSSSSAGTFDQSYHAEVFIPYEAGTLHFYALWSEATILGGTSDGSFWSNQYIGGLEDYEGELAEACATME